MTVAGFKLGGALRPVCEQMATDASVLCVLVWGDYDPEEARYHAYNWAARNWGSVSDDDATLMIDMYPWESARMRGGNGYWDGEPGDEIRFLQHDPTDPRSRKFWILELLA